MCGINGYLGVKDGSLIERMNQSISHRGPDGSGAYVDLGSKVALGHVRLSIIDLSAASDQPLISKCKRFVIVFNGEIYNYRPLREILIDKGYEFSSSGDGEVLLNLWIEYGQEALGKVDGIFSFAIYDTSLEKLVLVRDHFGVKPLYYSAIDGAIIFSSEIKGILQYEMVSRDIDINSVSAYLRYLWLPGENTILKEVKKLPPGCLLEFQLDKPFSQVKYYSLPSYMPCLDENEAIKKLQEELCASVHAQLVSDVPVGAFLSGGLDSSLLCSIAKEYSPDFSEVFTIDVGDFTDGFAADLPYAKKIAEKYNLSLNVVLSSHDDVEKLPECIFHLDEPQSDPAIINTYKICKLAKEKKIKVLFSGAGGDDIFTGYRRHILASYQDKIDRIPKFIKSVVSYVGKRVSTKTALGRRINKVAGILSKSGNEAVASYFSWIDEGRLKLLFLDCNRSVLDAGKSESLILESIENQVGNLVEKTLEIDKRFFLVDHNFNYTDKMSMAHGVEVRVPYVNRKMLDLASCIPTVIKQKNGIGKSILKKAAEKYLPKEIIYRSKTGFGAPVRDWLNGPLRPLVDKLLSKEIIERRGLFKIDQVNKLIDENRKGKCDYAYTIYALLSLEIWMKQFIDHSIPRKISMAELLNSADI